MLRSPADRRDAPDLPDADEVVDGSEGPDAREVAARLTRDALALLDLTFEPAAVCTGERFDLVMESLSDQLSDAGSALLAGRPVPDFAPPSLPAVAYADARRAQAMLREHIEDGHMPGNARSLTQCLDGLRAVQADLARTATAARDLTHPFLADLGRALTRLVRTLAAYRASFVRLSGLVAGPATTRAQAADAATRAERSLLRCLDRCGDGRILR